MADTPKFNRMQALRRRALAVGLDIATHSPGDGVTRFRFVRTGPRLVSEPSALPPQPRYHEQDGIGRCAGFRDAEAWIEAYGMGWMMALEHGGKRYRWGTPEPVTGLRWEPAFPEREQAE